MGVLKTYLNEINQLIRSPESEEYLEILNSMEKVIKRNGCIFLLGVGSCSTTADHFSNDLNKSFGSILYSRYKRNLNIQSTAELLTAYSNDNHQNNMFFGFLKTTISKNDLLIIFTDDDLNESIKRSLEYCYSLGIKVSLISGSNAESNKNVHTHLRIASDNPLVIRDFQMFLCHCWASHLINYYMQPFIVLDRDGVINKNNDNYIKSLDEFKFIEGSIDAIIRLNREGFSIIVVTNQSCINQEIISWEIYNKITTYMLNEIEKKGGVITEVYVCPHTIQENCNCRKPQNFLLEKAITEHYIDRDHSYLIGDHFTDIDAGLNSNLKTIFLKNGRGKDNEQTDVAFFKANHINEAVDWIIKDYAKSSNDST